MPPIAPLARPRVAGAAALVCYLSRAGLSTSGLRQTRDAYFNFLADAFLHGQLHLRLAPLNDLDLVILEDRVYLHFLPFPAVLLMPLVALFGVDLSDVVYTPVIAAISVALLAGLLQALDRTGLAPLSVERRALLVATVAFGSVLLILAPAGGVWFTAQIVGWGCVVGAALAALTLRGAAACFCTGLALACAAATRPTLLPNGLWLAYVLLRRQGGWSPRQRIVAAGWGLLPVVVVLLLLGWYNWARFGHPLETGWAWHNASPAFREELGRYGLFHVHYLPKNLHYELLGYTLFSNRRWMGGGLFWMTPVLLGAIQGAWSGRRCPLAWALVASCALVYLPLSVYMSTGFFTFGPRYLLDLLVPLLVLTARGIRRWPWAVLLALLLVSCATYAAGSALWFKAERDGMLTWLLAN